MAITDPTSLGLSAITNPGFSGWYPVSNSAWHIRNERKIPDQICPFYSFSVASLINNSQIAILSPDFSLLPFSTIGGGFALTVGVPAFGVLDMNRRYSMFSSGGSTLLGKSPRLGFNIGPYFKQQAYMKLSGATAGWVVGGFLPFWSSGFAYSEIEYYSNCRLKDYYMTTGRILGIVTAPVVPDVKKAAEDGALNEFWLSLRGVQNLGDLIEPEDNPPPSSGSTSIWSHDSKTNNYIKRTLSYSKPQGSLDWIRIPINEETKNISSGDFFELDKSWIIADPALLHEYDIEIRDGLFATKAQRSKVQGEVKGVWIKEAVKRNETTILLDVLYVDTPDAANFVLPPTPSGADAGQFSDLEMVSGISHKIGGGFETGWNKIKKDKLPIKIAVAGFFTKSTQQNLGGGFLTGKRLKIGKEYYEIQENPIDYTITLAELPITSELEENSLYSILNNGTKVSVSDLRMCQTTETYFNDGNQTSVCWSTNRFTKTDLEDQGVSTITWAISDEMLTAPSANGERAWGKIDALQDECFTLTQRYRTDIFEKAGSQTIKAYRKFDGWKLVCLTTERVYDVLYTEVQETEYGFAIAVTIDFDSSFPTAATIGIMFDEPYDKLSAKSHTLAQGAVSIENPRETHPDVLHVEGYYTTGAITINSAVPTGTLFEIVDHSFGEGADPAVFIQTKTGSDALSFFTKTYNNKCETQYVFFGDPKNNGVLSYRFGPMGWKEYPQQAPVVIGKISYKKPGESPSESMGRFGKPYVVDVKAEAPREDRGSDGRPQFYWFSQNIRNQYPIYSFNISGAGGIYDPISIYNNKKETTRNRFTQGRAYSINCPYLFFPSDTLLSASPCFSPLSTASVGGFSAPTLEQYENTVANGAELTPAIKHKPTEIGWAFESQLIKPNMFDVHKISGNRALLVYETQSPDDFKIGEPIDVSKSEFSSFEIKDNKFTSRSCVNIVVSSDDLKTWWNPLIPEEKIKIFGERTLDFAGTPLMIAYDFKYAGSATDNKNLYVFGYVFNYEEQRSASKMSLAMLKIPFSNLLNNNSVLYPCVYSNDNLLWALYLPPSTSETAEEELKWGNQKSSDGSVDLLADLEKGKIKSEFVTILGGKDVDPPPAIVLDPESFSEQFNLDQSPIAIQIDGSGTIRLVVRDYLFGLFSVDSFDLGFSWGFLSAQLFTAENTEAKENSKDLDADVTDRAKDITSPYIYSSSGTHPNFVSTAEIAYFKSNNLYFRIGGKPSDPEEILIEENIYPQRLASYTERSGHDKLIYIDRDKNIRSKESHDGGWSWESTPNW